MSKSRHRRFFAWLGILAIALAQFVATAHACTLGPAAAGEHRAAIVASGAFATPGTGTHCGLHHGAPSGAPANLCEVHCTDAATPVTALDLPSVAAAPMPSPQVALAVLSPRAARSEVARTEAQGGAPPLNLQFCRLLI